MKFQNTKINICIITSHPKARILLGSSFSENDRFATAFFNDDKDFLKRFSSGKESSSLLILIDADPLESFSMDLKVLKASLGIQNVRIAVFSLKDISDEFLAAQGAEKAFRMPFTLEDVRKCYERVENSSSCSETILFVDDSTLMHKMVESVVSGPGYIIEHAYDGKEGLVLAEKLKPDLIITDIEMPVMDGYEFCRKVKESENLYGIPVIIQSSLEDGLHIDKGFEAGADDYITKPINGPELLSRIQIFFNKVTEHRETILVADNSRMISNMIASGLKKQGFSCLKATDGNEILEIAEKEHVDLIILSQFIPGVESRDVVRTLRKNLNTKSCPIIMISTRNSEMDVMKNRGAGVNEFIPKPFSVDRLLVSVEKLLAESRFVKEKYAMSLYLSEATMSHAGNLAKADQLDTMRAEKGFRTILFIDIVGFTPLCEDLSPEDVISLLNDYFDLSVTIIRDNGGTIDKFVGDEVMAVFAGRENGTYLAIKSGLELLDHLEKFNETSLRKLSVRIGINAGEVVLGDLGSRFFRRDFTLIGDAVNVAQRLENSAPVNGILVSGSTINLVSEHFEVEQQGFITLKGKSEEIMTYVIKDIIDTI